MSTDGNMAFDAFLCVVPFAICALLNLTSAAVARIDEPTLKRLGDVHDRRAQRISYMQNPNSRIGYVVFLANALLLVVSAGAALRIFDRFFPFAVFAGWRILTVVLHSFSFTALAVVSPSLLAPYRAARFALMFSGLLRPVWAVLFLPALAMERISSLVIRMFGFDPSVKPHGVTEEEIRMMVNEGEQRGSIEVQEREMINNIFEFDDRAVTEVMTHRTEVAALPDTATLEDAAALFLSTGYSRIPVYEQNIDSIVGILYAKDLLFYLDSNEQFLLKQVMRRPLYIPETCSCSDALAMFRLEKTQMAVVVDEYGGTYGIVTMEDLLEAIVGNIQDEYDDEAEPATLISEGVYMLDGTMSISDAEKLLCFRMPEDHYAETLGGFVTELLGGVPGAGEQRSITFDGVALTVLQADEKRITKIRAAIVPKNNKIDN
jgi:putative hemolysin